MKIGILTFHASHNYGSMLQAYALQHYLNTNGHEAEVINLRINAQQNLYNYPLKPIKGKLKNYFKTLSNPIWLYHACRKWRNYEEFLKANLRLTPKIYKSWNEVQEDLPQLGYQCIITGGDQIWNMNCKDFSLAYYLPSPLPNIKKIAYSPSFGGTFLSKIAPNQEELIKKCLLDYSYISVRESSMQEYLGTFIDKAISVTVDPTLLLTANCYFKFISETPIVKGKYIFYYTPRPNKRFERLSLLIGQKYGMKVVTSFPHVYNKGFNTVPEAGPIEFLNLLKNASMVVGKSFHLVIFSLIFHKDFIAFDGDHDARMKSFLTILGIPERGIVNEENYKTISLPHIEFNKIDELIERERALSRKFLDIALTLNTNK